MNKQYIFFLVILCCAGCKSEDGSTQPNQLMEFGNPEKVEMIGYDGHIMEPFLTRDGKTLFFNNLNDPSENTNLHWAEKVNETTFRYKGEITGVNTSDLEGVPTMDSFGNLYFVSTRNYANTLSTLYQCQYVNGVGTNVQILQGVSKQQAGWVNFDIEVSADGQFIYFVDAQFDQSGNSSSADLVIAQKNATGFQRLSNSDDLLKNINTQALEYAACISSDQLELYFTRVSLPFTSNSSPEILYATRKNSTAPFSIPTKISTITGFAEAATITPDQSALYFHKKEGNTFVLYLIRKK